MEPYEYEELRQAKLAKWEEHFPVCECCEEHIVEGEDFVDTDIVDGYFHMECFVTNFKKRMPDWRQL